MHTFYDMPVLSSLLCTTLLHLWRKQESYCYTPCPPSGQEAHDNLLIRMKRLEIQQIRTLSEPLLPSAPPAQTGFSNLEYSAQPTYDPTLAGLA